MATPEFKEEVRTAVAENRIDLTFDARKDKIWDDIRDEEIWKAFSDGVIIRGSELYAVEVKDYQDKKDRYYCLCESGGKVLLISFVKKGGRVLFIHMDRVNPGSREGRYYDKNS